MFDVSFPDSLEKYGIVGAFIFAAAAAGGAAWWTSIVSAIEAYRKKKVLKGLLFRPLATSVIFIFPLFAAILVVESTRRELRHAANLLNGDWVNPSQECRYKFTLEVDPRTGRLTKRTPNRFQFIYNVDAVGENFVQHSPRGGTQPVLYERQSPDRLLEISMDGTVMEWRRC